MAFLDSTPPVAFAHRGFAPDGAENSMAAFENAVRLGYQYLETDVRVTADGVALAFHDAALDRVTDRRGRIAGLPWRVVQQARIAGTEPIPLLVDVLTAWPDVCINLDVNAILTARNALDELLGVEMDDGPASEVTETFGTDIGEVLAEQIQLAISRTGKPVAALTRDEKVAVVRSLDESGAFLVKRAADRIARALGTSRVTVYAYLEQARSVDGSGSGRRVETPTG